MQLQQQQLQLQQHQYIDLHHHPQNNMVRTGTGGGGGKADAKPRGRMTAYAYFVQTCREEHKKKHPDETVIFAEFSRKCAERWKVSFYIVHMNIFLKHTYYFNFCLRLKETCSPICLWTGLDYSFLLSDLIARNFFSFFS